MVAMVPTTAACFLLGGVALLLILRRRVAARRAALVPIIPAVAILLTNLILSLLGSARGVEDLLIQSWEERDAMAVGTEVAFLAAFACLAMTAEPRWWSDRAFVLVSTFGLLVAGIASIGYAFDSEDLYSTLVFDAMALHTSLGLLVFHVAILLAQPTVGWVGLLLSRGSGSRRARKIFLLVLAAPLLLCLLALEMTRVEIFSENLRLAMLSIAMMSLSAIVALQDARRQNEVEFFARHDPLTKLPNRGLFYEELDAALSSARQGKKVGLVLIDLDHFKQINDTKGHLAGDVVLQVVARRLKGALRPEDVAARLGGDEFAAIIPRKSTEEIVRDAKLIHASLGGGVDIDRLTLQPSFSVGVAVFCKSMQDPEELLRNADVALYETKASGRNGVRIFRAPTGIEGSSVRSG